MKFTHIVNDIINWCRFNVLKRLNIQPPFTNTSPNTLIYFIQNESLRIDITANIYLFLLFHLVQTCWKIEDIHEGLNILAAILSNICSWNSVHSQKSKIYGILTWRMVIQMNQAADWLPGSFVWKCEDTYHIQLLIYLYNIPSHTRIVRPCQRRNIPFAG